MKETVCICELELTSKNVSHFWLPSTPYLIACCRKNTKEAPNQDSIRISSPWKGLMREKIPLCRILRGQQGFRVNNLTQALVSTSPPSYWMSSLQGLGPRTAFWFRRHENMGCSFRVRHENKRGKKEEKAANNYS